MARIASSNDSTPRSRSRNRGGRLPYAVPFGASLYDAPQSSLAFRKRESDSSRPRISKVASMGGETVPPQTASRIGCASLPSETPLAVASPLMSSWMAGADQSASCPSPLAGLGEQRKHLRGDVLAHRLLIVGGGRPKEERAVRRHLAQGLGAFALREHDAARVAHHRCASMPSRFSCQRSTGTMPGGRSAHHVLLIEPGELLDIEGRGRFVDIARCRTGESCPRC